MIATQLESDIISQLTRVRAAARELALCSSEVKNRALTRLSGALRASGSAVLAANARDLEQARAQGVKPAFLERLTLNPARIEAMALSVEQVAALPDPVGEVIAGWRRPNGLEISQVRVPIGTIAIVYESRPNVTVEAAVLALKAGNGAVLRGGKESLATNRMLAGLVGDAMDQAGAPAGALFFVPTPDREVIRILKQSTGLIDLIIPRGGIALKEALAGSEVPVLPHFDGICHVYIDDSRRFGQGRGDLLQRQMQPPLGLQRDGKSAGALQRGGFFFAAAGRANGQPSGGTSRMRAYAGDFEKCASSHGTGLGHRVSGPDSRDQGGRFAR